MGRHRRCARSLFAVVVVATVLHAQQRRPCLGNVVDAAGAPLAGAEVTFVRTPGWTRPGRRDIVRTTSDARGRFKAELIVGSAYSAWAIGPAGADGTCMTSEVTDRAAAGVVLELAAWHPRAARRLQCSGLERWLGDDPIRLRWYCDRRQDVAVDLTPSADGSALLPPGPWTTGMVALLDGEGRLLVSQTIDAAAEEPTAAFEAPQEATMLVVDAHDRPVAGAAVEQMLTLDGIDGDATFLVSDPRWRHAGVSDAAGRAQLRLVGNDLFCLLRIDAGTMRCYSMEGPRPGAREFHVVLPEAGPRPGEVRGIRDGEEVSAKLLSTFVPLTVGSAVLSLPLTISAAGQFTLEPTSVTGAESTVSMQVAPLADGVPRHALLHTKGNADRLPSIDLDGLRRWRVRAVDIDGSPRPGATLFVTDVPRERTPVSDDGLHLVVDHAGRAELLLDDSECAVYATTGTAHALAFVDPGRDGGELVLRLEPLPTARLRVIDVDGRPCAHARIEHRPWTGFGSVLIDGRSKVQERIGQRIAITSALCVRSGRDGLLDVPVQDWVSMQLQICVRVDGRRSEPFRLVATDDVVDVIVR